MQNGNRRKFPRIIFPLLMVAFVLLLGIPVMLLWNAIVTPVLHAERLTYWQAVGLLALCRILTGGPGFRGRPGPGRRQWPGNQQWRQKWMNMSDDERTKMKEEWKQRCRSRKGM